MATQKTLDDKSVLLVVDFHQLGNTRKVSMSQVAVDADKTMLRMNKSLLDSAEYSAIKTHDGQTRAWLYTRALPSLFKEGVFRVPNTLVVEVDEYLATRRSERQELVNAFRATYAENVQAAMKRLNGLANPKDYLSPDEAASRFGISWRYVTFDTPNALKNLKDGLFEREKEKIAKLVQEAQEEIKVVLRVQMSALVKRMITQLTPASDGKKKKIYDSLTGNVEDFLDTFDARNIADDHELKELVSKARAALAGVDPTILRNAEDIRKDVKNGFEVIGQQLDKMIIDKPTRHFDFT